ncbi:ribbon-helix-helix domain-containing protein [Halosegnis marinus]|uniref:ribbon-helix-helix domain-containing protein n=1 Tax=Halosegnis marinus TaxID=3034023 RepID=UPI003617BECC
MGAHAHDAARERRPGTDYAKWLLVAGFLALAGALAAAHTTPARGYELSIYAGTPLAFWVGTGVAVVAAVVALVVLDAAGALRGAALLLVSLAGFGVWALPVVRGYYYFGSGDALSHLGYAAEIAAGDLSTLDLLYPGLHTTGLAVSAVTGVRLGLAVELVVVAFLAAFLVFVPLCVRTLADGRAAVAVGAVAALLVLPVNNVSVHPVAHPTTQAILLAPALVYLLARYATAPTRGRSAAPYAVLLVVVGSSLVLLHPQQALNAVLLLAAVSGAQLAARRYRPAHRVATHRLVAGPTVLLAALWVGWSVRHERVSGSVEGVAASLAGGAAVADEATQRAGSLADLGGSIGELFVKLFGVSLVFVAVTGVVALLVRRRGFGSRSDRDALRAYLTVSLLPLAALFVVFFAASVTTQYFRHLGFLMVVATVVGAAGLADAGEWLARRWSPGSRGPASPSSSSPASRRRRPRCTPRRTCTRTTRR